MRLLLITGLLGFVAATLWALASLPRASEETVVRQPVRAPATRAAAGAQAAEPWAPEPHTALEALPDTREEVAAGAPSVVPTGSLCVHVADGSGTPLPDVRVQLEDPHSGAVLTAWTTSSGEAFFEAAPAGRGRVRVAPPDGRTWVVADEVAVVAETTTDLYLVLPTAILRIAGRALDRDGRPQSGVEIDVVRLTEGEPHVPLVPWPDGTGRETTLEDGAYTIEGVPPGTYALTTRASDLHPSRRLVVRAGCTSADFVLPALARRRVTGRVTDPDGRGIAGVQAVPLHAGESPSTTSLRGYYELSLTRMPEAGLRLRFSKTGYQDRLECFEGEAAGQTLAPLCIDTVLERWSSTGVVDGRVASARGDVVGDARVYLFSEAPRCYRTTRTDAHGEFRIPDVPPGEAYRLRIVAPPGFEDFSLSPLPVREQGFRADVVLAPLGTARLRGRLRDPAGRPVGSFRGRLRSTKATGTSVWLETDAAGHFDVRVPAGEIGLESATSIFLAVSGLVLEPEQDREQDLVVDWGSETLEGVVVRTSGHPVPGATVRLEWSSPTGALRSRSRRTTTTDVQGCFRFAELGGGSHVLHVSSAADTPRSTSVVVGEDAPPVRILLGEEE